MKNLPVKFLLLSILNFNCISSSDTPEVTPSHFYQWTEQKTTALTITSLLAAYGLYQYVRQTYKLPEEFYVESSFPYAQAWFEAMADKYPEMHLDQKKFLQALRGTPKEETLWQGIHNSIYAPQVDLQFINDTYKKQLNKKQLTEVEVAGLYQAEWIMLHEASHTELNYSFKTMIFVVGSVAILETLKMIIKESTDDSVRASMQKTLDGYFDNDFIKNGLINTGMWARYIGMTGTEFYLFSILSICFIRDQEAQTDAYANQHADNNALQGGAILFQRYIDMHKNAITETQQNIESDESFVSLLAYFDITPEYFARNLVYFIANQTHPSLEYRAEQIHAEIARRLTEQSTNPA